MSKEMEVIKKGKWYLPNNSIQVEGILRFTNQEGATLETFGGLIPFNASHNEKKIEIILGETLEGELITLLDCFRTSHTEFSISGRSSAKYYSNYVFIGQHFFSAEILFKNIEVQIPNLLNWLSISGFANFPNNWNDGIELKYKKPYDLNFVIDGTKTMSFIFDQNYSWSGRFDFTIKQEATLVFTSTTSVKFQEWLRQIHTFTYFLSFCYFKFSAPTSFRILLEEKTNYIYILFKNVLSPTELAEDFFMPLVNFSLIKNNFGELISNLYSKSVSLEPILFTLGTSYKKTTIVPELYFLTMMQAIETYHRRFIGGNIKPDDEWELIKKEILESIHENHNKLVTEALQFKNELSLRNRLKYLLAIVPETIQNRLLINKKSDFIKLIVDLRNYYTHYDINNTPDFIDNESLINLTYKIRIILGFSLLCELGLDKEIVTNILINSGQIYFTS